ncbi:GMC family oxidoreductase [Fuscibacter oryzae]|uniref:GMC family oxidoreductase N-terminal domain-containing protein n=1 Tax=Fuscibacter oryzae TaxID=2803939 RepID=A0A8J7MXV0_9RHOB|nr:GMC family oxidoreductase N-terminal domain-containing protein [Fuscibacter oryzae]MBL4930131.1 GMC family oxidoreductase N-terminal domain-containing protein [Fuscibacter oryzae]
MDSETFDYVIAGGGSAGSVLAARLSENPRITVCLVEAGGRGDGLLVRMPAGTVAMLPGRPRINNWAYQTVPQPGLNGRRGYQPRGRCLGGSSAINAMLYVRGQRQDYDDWQVPGWGWDDVLPWFLRSENNARGADAFHGDAGPLQVTDQQSPRPVSRAFVQAGQQAGHPLGDDFNTGDNYGVGLYQVTQFHEPARRGERCSAAAAYLHPVMGRANLRVITGAQATGVRFAGRRATGLSYRQGGQDRHVNARREVIVSAGTFGSPQLLMLSGIGPAHHLHQMGITLRHDLPQVGANLQDHLDFILSWRSRDRDNFGIGLRAGLGLVKQALQWRKTGQGMLATPFAEGAGFLKTDPGLDRPDVQLHFVIGIVDDHARKLHLGHGLCCHVCTLRPHSRGQVRLASADPLAAPAIDPGFLSDPRDLATTIAGARLTRDIMMQPAMAPYLHTEMFGTHGAMSDAEWESHIRARADTIYHPVGTCRMGLDAASVVDPNLRVRGMEGLRVVDASVMPSLVSGNTNAPTIMIAERAARAILSEPACA